MFNTPRSSRRAVSLAVAMLMSVAVQAAGPGAAEPATSLQFVLEIEGTRIGGFTSVSGLSASTEVVEYRDGSSEVVRKLPGPKKYEDITLKRGLVKDDALHDWIWNNLDPDGTSDTRDGAFVFVGPDGAEILRYRFVSAWPCQWRLLTETPGPGDGADRPNVIAEEVVICMDWFRDTSR